VPVAKVPAEPSTGGGSASLRRTQNASIVRPLSRSGYRKSNLNKCLAYFGMISNVVGLINLLKMVMISIIWLEEMKALKGGQVFQIPELFLKELPTTLELLLKIYSGILLLRAILTEIKLNKIKSIYEGYIVPPFSKTAPDLETFLIRNILTPLLQYSLKIERIAECKNVEKNRIYCKKTIQSICVYFDSTEEMLGQLNIKLTQWYGNYFKKNKINRRLFNRMKKEFNHDANVARENNDSDSAAFLVKMVSWKQDTVFHLINNLNQIGKKIDSTKMELNKVSAMLVPSVTSDELDEINQVVISRYNKIEDELLAFKEEAIPIIPGVQYYFQRLYEMYEHRRTILIVAGFSFGVLSEAPIRIAKLFGIN
jgi:hypothetical protein